MPSQHPAAINICQRINQLSAINNTQYAIQAGTCDESKMSFKLLSWNLEWWYILKTMPILWRQIHVKLMNAEAFVKYGTRI